ncbi:GAF sensor signal transduction histidine kinase [Deinococcus irradiatisoli]|uniref:histidine kinase n=1 Tax=Deinococcus irradiatisoli TaxID=2202254 RepID=A0A2Z3JKA6_9DEIO|nr:GAF domain-containing protein [Deinococcus irradiatisoli]AWN24296.1 GAF sensor signal transduction histidine kinase [Deinococcus irradiatisoli]
MTSPPHADPEPFTPLAEHLQAITEALAATTTQREVIEIILTPAVQALGAIAGIVLLVDQTDQQLKIGGSQGYEDVTLTVWQESAIEDHQLISDILRMGEAMYFEHEGELRAAYPELEGRTGKLSAVANAVLPMFLDHQPLGVIVLDFSQPHHFTSPERRFLKILSAQCAVALGRAQATRQLEARVKERTQQLEEERTALEIFVAFTEAVGSQTEVRVLVQQAMLLLQDTCDVEVAYVEREGELFKATIWNPSADPTLLALLQDGFTLQTSGIAKLLQANTAAFIDHWRDTPLLFGESAIFQAVAGYPYFVAGELQSVLLAGSRMSAVWAEREKKIFQAVGRSLGLALERAEQARRLEQQNAELHAQTLALEGVAELTRDLTMPNGPHHLIDQVMDLVLSLLPPGYTSYWEIREGRWQLINARGDVGSAEAQTLRQRGFTPGEMPSLDQPWQTRQPYFQDKYDPLRDQVPEMTGHMISVAMLPVLVRGEAAGVFGVGLFGYRTWSAADRALLATAVHSLGLALERAGQAHQLTTQRDRLQAANEELEAFTYSVSHDLRTPVRHISSFGELLRRALPAALDQKAERYLSVIETAAATLNELIDGMLELSRTSRQPMRTEQVDLGWLVAAVQKEVGAAEPTRRITWQVASLPTVTGDAGLLRQVITALLSNAVKYTRPRPEARIEVWAEDQGQTWAVRVRDNGVGFDPRYRDKLFTVFQRLHRQEDFAGAGVSLANARRIMARHGGLMTAEGQLDGGATFGFILPKTNG